jgi:hypothetical protein
MAFYMFKIRSSSSKSPSRHNKNHNPHGTQSTQRAQNRHRSHDTQGRQNTQKKPNIVLSIVLSAAAFLGICFVIALLVVHSFGVGHIIRNIDVLGFLEDFSTDEYAYYIVDQLNGLPFNETEVTLYDMILKNLLRVNKSPMNSNA